MLQDVAYLLNINITLLMLPPPLPLMGHAKIMSLNERKVVRMSFMNAWGRVDINEFNVDSNIWGVRHANIMRAHVAEIYWEKFLLGT